VYRFYEVVFIGLASACQVMIGNSIGAGDEEIAKSHAKQFMILNQLLVVIAMVVLVLTASWNVSLFGLPPEVSISAANLVKIYGVFSFFKCFNLLMIVGVLRGGGDTHYAMRVELAAVWLVGVPLSFICAVLLKWPIEWTVSAMMMEEVIKSIFCFYRYLSNKWCHNVIKNF
jgi:Na+-driven multidrug efflux pump